MLRNIFAKAKAIAPCIIFFDELESFLPRRDKANHNYEKTLVTTFLSQMDGFSELKDVLVIASTNYPDAIDPALRRPGRFDNTIYVGLPDNKSRQKQFEHYLNKLGSFNYEELALNSEGFSCADIEALTRKIKELELDHLIQNEDKKITQEDCLKIIRDFKNNYQKN